MHANDFRRIALALRDVVEGAHMGHPDFRLANRIFASLHTSDRFGMVALTPDQQARFISEHPGTFTPESGAWGRAGSTRVLLECANEDAVGEALTLARRNAAAKGPTRPSTRKR